GQDSIAPLNLTFQTRAVLNSLEFQNPDASNMVRTAQQTLQDFTITTDGAEDTIASDYPIILRLETVLGFSETAPVFRINNETELRVGEELTLRTDASGQISFPLEHLSGGGLIRLIARDANNSTMLASE